MATSPGEGVSIRTLRLKVLYTFDLDQKDNHLARWPQPLEVQTAFIDESNQIGVIDLKTCLEAVTTASPELTAHLENDYTVYAYDYSEPDTPLVGQGLLSKAMAVQAQPSDAENDALVTGRITKNIMGLFSRNAQETLEVKLRLTPVSTFNPRYRSGSVSSQDGTRPLWANNTTAQNLPRSTSPVDITGLEAMHRMLNREPPQAPAYPESGSRPTTPTLAQAFNPPARQGGIGSRPSSRAGRRQPTHERRDSFNSGYYSGDENADEGPSRKRARTTKVDWPTKASFNIEKQPDSLRVVASTASSVRLHRPVALNPFTANNSTLPTEEPVRPPTPIPASKAGKPRGRPRKNAPSTLNRGSQVRESSPMTEPNLQSQLLTMPGGSPEDTRGRSVSSTPANIPSSPPVMPEPSHPAVTSPVLPTMLGSVPDSGFMSGNLDDLFGDPLMHFDDFIHEKHVIEGDLNQVEAQDQRVSISFPPVFEENSETIPERSTQPKGIMVPPPPPAVHKPFSRAQSYTPATRPTMSSPKLAPAPVPRARQIMEEQQRKEQRARASIQPSQVPKSDPAPRLIQRSQTWAPDSDALMSEAPTMEEARAKAASKKKVGKEQTRARLENAIANGEMPPYCDNCGAIETPAWRRGYAKIFDCAWDEVETSLEAGHCCFKEVLSHNTDGSIKTFRGYKCERQTGDEEDNWGAIILCNPCGLWLHKQKCPRPAEKWQKKEPGHKGKRKRNQAKTSKRPNGNPSFKSDAQTPASDDSSPADTATEAPDGEDNDNDDSNNDEFVADDNEPQLPEMPRSNRASSAEPGPRGLQNRARHRPAIRQVQSSPGHPQGSESMPIEIGFSPKPIRRQLFPSPDKVQVRSDPGQYTTTLAAAAQGHSMLPAFVRRSPRLNKTRDVFAPVMSGVVVEVNGKENMAPAVDSLPMANTIDDGLDHLFEEGPVDLELPPMTPTPKRRSERILLKTPSKTPSRQFGADLSPNADLHPVFRTPKARSNNQHALISVLLGTSHKDVSTMTPFSRSIHDAITSDAPHLLNMPEDGLAPLRRSSKKATPNKAINFDFPDLPSLKDSSPMSGNQLVDFNLSEMTTDQINSDFHDPFASHSTLPSSPPPGMFDFLDTQSEEMAAVWNELMEDEGDQQDSQESTKSSAEPVGARSASFQPRRSPRKQHAG